MITTFLAVADVHLGLKPFNQPELEEDLYVEFMRAAEVAIAKKVDFFIVVGDLFDTNRPAAYTVDRALQVSVNLREAGIKPVAISGDHDKPVNGAHWTRLAGFEDINDHPNFAGVHYSDDPVQVAQQLDQLFEQKEHVEFAFLHGQAPELFGFCEEKKTLKLKESSWKKHKDHFRGFILGDIHAGVDSMLVDPAIPVMPYLGYCGSLGVTRMNELEKLGYLWFDGNTLQRLPYTLRRPIHKITIPGVAWFDILHDFKKAVLKQAAGYKEVRPLYLVNYAVAAKSRLQDLSFLYDLGMVKTYVIDGSDDETEETRLVLREDVSGGLRKEQALKQCIVDPAIRKLAMDVLDAPEPKLVLDEFTKSFFAT